jgi:ATPase subunit of ABC transporter with duplicated ATPase domains
MANNDTIVRFTNVSHRFGFNKIILDEVSFSMRQNMKIALMGQNGAGKSTIFKLMTGEMKPESGEIAIDKSLTVATARQVISHEDRELTISEYFQKYSGLKDSPLQRAIANVLGVVNLHAPIDKKVKDFSGGQQARLLLAAALIQNPDLLLLDEPTNNLDPAGIEHLMTFLIMYPKSVLIISHDADFLNAFTEGVLYVDTFTHKIEQYAGNYYDVVEQIAERIEKENRQNSRLKREAIENKEKANYFAHKGGHLRNVAMKMREKAEELEENMVDVRREDKTIREFTIPAQQDLIGPVLTIDSFTILQNHTEVTKQTHVIMGKREHMLVAGPNGIGKSTLIEGIATGTAKGATITPGVRVGYYRQDFSTLNNDHTIYESLIDALNATGQMVDEHELRSTAAGFLLTSEVMKTRIGHASEGQKGLVSFARLVLQKPGLLILDEPTNHINFRHLPVIARALDSYEGAMILISHIPDFVAQIRIDRTLDLEK